MLAPIIIFTYNRVNHVKNALNSLARCYMASDSDIIVFADGPKEIASSEKVFEVQNFVKNFEWRGKFNSYQVCISDRNKGLGKSVIDGVSEIIKLREKVIVLEDDLIVSRSFIKYMNDALNYYVNNTKVWSISGYTFNIPSLKKYQHDTYSILRGCSWGWATWRNRWERVDWKVSDYDTMKFNFFKRKAFGRGGNDLPTMLDAQMYGDINSWAIRWCYQQFKEQQFTIYPIVSKVMNGGMDGTGTHSEKTRSFNTFLDDSLDYCLEYVEPDRTIEREFRAKYHRTIASRIKTYIKYVIVPTIKKK